MSLHGDKIINRYYKQIREGMNKEILELPGGEKLRNLVERENDRRRWKEEERERKSEEYRARGYLQGKKINYKSVIIKILIDRDGDACKFCSKGVSVNNVSIDHKIPRSKGGSGSIDNLQLMHKECNSRKGNRIP